MDFNEHRNLLIQYNGLENTDDMYTFYYDETNNIRKLYLTESGTNVVRPDNFVLAGLLHKGLRRDLDFSALFDVFALQKSAKELKLKHVAKGHFLDMLRSEKICFMLKWLSENGFYIHYFNLNIIFWSIVDIVDSIVAKLPNPFYLEYHFLLKSDLYELANSNQVRFLLKLKEFNYPDVPNEKGVEFCKWLISLVEENPARLPDFNALCLRTLFKDSLILKELPFISGSRENELIDSFMFFYFRNIYLFQNSLHVFDIEKNIQSDLEKLKNANNDESFSNYTFVESHACQAVQISDVISGFLGKYFTYLKDVDHEQLKADKSALTVQQKETLKALKEIIDKSGDLSTGFFNVVSTEGEKIRNNWFLHGV